MKLSRGKSLRTRTVLARWGEATDEPHIVEISVSAREHARPTKFPAPLLSATGPIVITEGERTELRVTVTQRSTGAAAEGVLFFTGTGQTNQWEITAVAEGRAKFEAGPATVVGLARSSSQGQATDAHQGLVNVTLLGE